MTIREATAGDGARLDALLTKLIREESEYDPNLNPSYAVCDNYEARLGGEGQKAFVAEIDGCIVGYVYGFLYQIPGMHLCPVAILDALYVEAGCRRAGIAQRLYAAFRSFAAENGAQRIELKVLSANEKALKLYEKLGFGEQKKYMSVNIKERLDSVDYEKRTTDE